MRWTLYRKALAFFFAFSALPLLALSAFSVVNSCRGARAAVATDLERRAGDLAHEVGERLLQAGRELDSYVTLGLAPLPGRVIEARPLPATVEQRLRAPGHVFPLSVPVDRIALFRADGTLLCLADGAVFHGGVVELTRFAAGGGGAMVADSAGVAAALAAGGQVVFLRSERNRRRGRLRLARSFESQGAGRRFVAVADFQLARLLAEVTPPSRTDARGRPGLRAAGGTRGTAAGIRLAVVDAGAGVIADASETNLLRLPFASAVPGPARVLAERLADSRPSWRALRENIGFAPAGAAATGATRGSPGATIHGSGRWLDEQLCALFADADLGLAVAGWVPLRPVYGPVLHGARFTVLATLATMIVALLLLLVASRSFHRAVAALAGGARAFAAGDLEHRVRIRTGDETEALAEAMNRMADDLARLTGERETAARFESVHRVAASLAHDLKGSITSLAMLAANLRRHGDDARVRERLVEGLGRLSASMQRLVDQLPRRGEELSFRPHPSDVGREVERILDGEELAAGGAMTVVRDIEAGIVAAIDVQLLERCLLNLLRNAMTATGGGGTIVAAVRRGPPERLARLEPAVWRVGAAAWQALVGAGVAEPRLRTGAARRAAGGGDADWCAVAVADDGCGMSRAFVDDELFRPFATTRARGLGLGMPSVLDLMSRQGGDLVVHSEPDTGTAVVLLFPVAGARAGGG